MTFKTPANNSVIEPVGIAMKPSFGSMDNLGRLRTSRHQNIYEADFEYGTQPMRWENYVVSPTVSITATGTTGNVVATSSATGNVIVGMPVFSTTAGVIPTGAYVVSVNSTAGSNSVTLSQAPTTAVSSGTVVLGKGSYIAQLPGSGGVRMRLSTASGDVTIRQTRPYHRYQPGKTMVMSTAVNLGTAQTGQRQRVGFFDDGNGVFFEQADPTFTNTVTTFTASSISGQNFLTGISNTASMYIGMPVTGPNINPSTTVKDTNGTLNVPYTTFVTNIINSTAVGISSSTTSTTTGTSYSFTSVANPYGMYVVVRSDVNSTSIQNYGTNAGTPTDQRYPLPIWNGDQATIQSLDWSRIQMIWMEYTWYGAGMTRWGVVINGEWIVLHYVGFGNKGPVNTTNAQTGVFAYPAQIAPWSRTGNLPVRYEQRNIAATTSQNDMYHWGVSVIVEGGQDEQRGFTYSYGMANTAIKRQVGSGAAATRYPVLSVASRVMGTIEMSGNSSYNAPTSASNTTSITFTANTTFDGVLASSTLVSWGNANNIITVPAGTSNVFVGQSVTSATAGIPAGATVTYVNSSAYTISAQTTAAASGVLANTYTNNTFVGRHIYFPQQGTSNTGVAARVTGSNSTVITFGDIVTNGPIVNTASMTGTPFQIGLINRGQLLPKKMYISCDAPAIVELISSTTSSPILLTGATFATLANIASTNTISGTLVQANGFSTTNGAILVTSGLGSNNSFAMRDVSATAMTGGEVVFALTSPAGGSGLQEIDLSYFFPLYNTVSGNQTDVLTVAITTTGTAGANVGVHIIAQEAMS